jgi:3-phosphoshikimate 1-carboxyvinyltransferase
MGARVSEERGDSLPLLIRGGGLEPIRYECPVASAQVKSAILLAGLTANVPVTVVEPIRSRDHTERLLRFIGVDLRTDGLDVELPASGDLLRTIRSLELNIPGDPSSAAFLVAAVILAGRRELLVERVSVNPTRTGFLEVLRRMGAQVRVEHERDTGGEPVADLIVRPASLRGTEVHAEEIPGLVDEVPILAMLAARAVGETNFRAVGELRVKESNRLDSLAENLRQIGVQAEVSGDDLHISGTELPLSGRIETGGDHRISMAFSVLGAAPRVSLEISETASTGISYPKFFEDLRAVRGYD